MATITVEGAELVVRLTGWEWFGAGLSGARELRFPRASVAGVTTCVPAMAGVRGWRTMGTGIPGVIALGSRRVGGLREFVVVHARDPGSLLVDLVDQRYARLVVSVADPDGTVAALR